MMLLFCIVEVIDSITLSMKYKLSANVVGTTELATLLKSNKLTIKTNFLKDESNMKWKCLDTS